jgi:hypothetical protein
VSLRQSGGTVTEHMLAGVEGPPGIRGGQLLSISGFRRMTVDTPVRSVAVWMRNSGQLTETHREVDVNPLICIRGSASPGHSYPMTPLYVRNIGGSPTQVPFSVNPGDATTWLKVSPVAILPGKSASVPLTLVVPSNAVPGEDYVILTAGGTHFDVRFSVGVSPPRECLAAGYKPVPGTSTPVLLWLIILAVVIPVAFRVRNRLTRR